MTALGCILNLGLRQEGATGVAVSQEGSVKVVEELRGKAHCKDCQECLGVWNFLGQLVRGSVCLGGECSDRACTR